MKSRVKLEKTLKDNKILKFLYVSGTGWIIDFCIYFVLTKYMMINVGYANFISAIPALTFVFIVSTKNIFKSNNHSKFSLKTKYIIYFSYQMLLIFIVSNINLLLFNQLTTSDIIKIEVIANNLEILCKCLITPITMICNYLTMKALSEKL